MQRTRSVTWRVMCGTRPTTTSTSSRCRPSTEPRLRPVSHVTTLPVMWPSHLRPACLSGWSVCVYIYIILQIIHIVDRPTDWTAMLNDHGQADMSLWPSVAHFQARWARRCRRTSVASSLTVTSCRRSAGRRAGRSRRPAVRPHWPPPTSSSTTGHRSVKRRRNGATRVWPRRPTSLASHPQWGVSRRRRRTGRGAGVEGREVFAAGR